MSLQILLGASGHGKTHQLYEQLICEAVEHPQKRYILIVPEQSSLQAQKQIVRMHQNHGVFNIDVLTFGRLSYRIFEELGIELPEVIDETGKNLVIRRLMDEVRDQLRIIRPSKRQGFIGDIKSMLSEMKQYGITPTRLEELIQAMPVHSRLCEKLKDLKVIYEAYNEAMRDKYITAEDKPELLLSVIERSVFLHDTVVALDGFTGFTPVQYRLLRHMLAECSELRVTVTLPEDEEPNVIRGEEELFYMSKQMIAQCSRLADELRIPVEVKRVEEDYSVYRYAQSEELDFLERNIFRYNGRVYGKPNHAICVHTFPRESDEVNYVAADLIRRVREQGLRFRDFAVVTGDVAAYSRELTRIFTEAQIPYFLDEKRSILGNPLVELIRGAIEVVTQNASYESIFHALKNVLCPMCEEDVDRLENYVLATGVRGWNRYREPFCRQYPDRRRAETLYRLSTVDPIREQVLDYLDTFYTEMTCGEKNVAGYVKAIYRLLESVDAYGQLEELAASLEQSGRPGDAAKATEYRKCYAQVIGLLERFYSLMETETMPVTEFAEILDAGFDEIKVGIIPPSADCVTIGDLKRTRLDDIQVLYVVGVNEGLIPKTEETKGILSEQEREQIEQVELATEKIDLAPTTRQKIYEQNFYLYLNLTKPKRELILTYHDMTEEGEKCRSSRLVHLLKGMYGDNIVAEDPVGSEALLYGPGNALHLATEQHSPSLLAYLWQEEPYHTRIEQMLKTYMQDASEDSLSSMAAHELYHELRTSNVTRVEGYAGCAFAHFAEYGLELEERRLHRISAMDLGNLFHEVLASMGEKLKKEGKTFADLTEDDRRQQIHDHLESILTQSDASIFTDSATNSYMQKRVENMLNRTVWALGNQLAAGDFVPAMFEKPFTFDSDGVTFYGKVDRVDLYEDEDAIHVKIIDYKSGKKDINFADVYAGLQLQLLVYLQDMLQTIETAHPTKKVVAAAAFYNRIDDPYTESDTKLTPEDCENNLLHSLRPTGVLNEFSSEYMDRDVMTPGRDSLVIPAKTKADGSLPIKDQIQSDEHLRQLAQYATKKMAGMSREITDGRIEVNPYRDSCTYCPYGAICGHERPGHQVTYRNKLKMKEEEFWEKLGEETEVWN